MTDDIDRIMAIMDAAFDPEWGEAWTRRQVGDSLALPSTHYVLVDELGEALDDDRESPAAGFALTRFAVDEEELLLIAVAPAHRGRGVGRCLLELAFARSRERGATRMFLEMRANNPAKSLYRSVGFEPIGLRKRYYRFRSGENGDAITFARSL